MSVINGRGIFAGGGGFKSFVFPSAIFDGTYDTVKSTPRNVAFDGSKFYTLNDGQGLAIYDINGNLISSATVDTPGSYWNRGLTKYGLALVVGTSAVAEYSLYTFDGTLITTFNVAKPSNIYVANNYALGLTLKDVHIVVWNTEYSGDKYQVSFVDRENIENVRTVLPFNTGAAGSRKSQIIINHTLDDYIVLCTSRSSVMYDVNGSQPSAFASVIWPKYEKLGAIMGPLFVAFPVPFGS